jgi:hypothetical protein
MSNLDEEYHSQHKIGVYIAVGAGLGSALGAISGGVFDILPFSLSIGIAIGSSFISKTKEQ